LIYPIPPAGEGLLWVYSVEKLFFRW